VETLRFFHPTYWSDELKFAALEISSAALMLGDKQQQYSIFKHSTESQFN
jgi:hypothetical protein